MALSQRDIDDLINSVMKKAVEGKNPQVAKARLRVYDFKKPDKFSKDQLRGAQLLFDNFARQLTAHFSNLFRMAIHVDVASIDQITYDVFTKALPNPCIVAIVAWDDLPSNMLANMSIRVILPMLDRMCGGEGNPSDVSRPLTEIERSMVRRIGQGMSDILSATMKEFRINHSLSVAALETNPLFIQQAMAPNELVLSATVNVSFGKYTGQLEIALPHVLLEPVLPALSANRWFAGGTQEALRPEDGDTVLEALERVEIPISCRLGETMLPLEDIVAMNVGDIVDLDVRCGGQATLYIFGKPKFRAQIGRKGNLMAAKITSLAEEREGDPD